MAKSLHSKDQPETALSTKLAGALPIPYEESAKVTQVFQSISPYVAFPYPIGQATWMKVVAKYPMHKQGRPVLFHGQEIIALDPFEFFFVVAKQFFVEEDGTGNPVNVTEDAASGWAQYVETVLLLIHDEQIIPARVLFKKMLVGGIYPTLEALKLANTPEWGQRSPEHKATFALPDPRFRFYSQCRINDVQSKSTGRILAIASATVHPTNLAQIKMLDVFFGEGPNKLLDSCMKDYATRLETLRQKM